MATMLDLTYAKELANAVAWTGETKSLAGGTLSQSYPGAKSPP